MTLPHVKINQSTPNVKATVCKDGQIFTANINLEGKATPYIYYTEANASDVIFYVNFNPAMLRTLRNVFDCKLNTHQQDLQYCYNMLCDGAGNHIDNFAQYTGIPYIPYDDVINENLNGFGDEEEPVQNLFSESDASSYPSVNNFANNLYKAVLESSGYLSFTAHWHCAGEYEYIMSYHIW